MPEPPILTAHWSELLLLNFAVPPEVIARLAPAGTEPDLHDGRAYASVVGFRFHAARLFGLPMPGHTDFLEINLRYYVRRKVGGEIRRGVVFVREIVPRRAVALVANWFFHEKYIVRPMRSERHAAAAPLAPGNSVEYAWSDCLRLRNARWNRLAARVAVPAEFPRPDSLEAFFVEHYWGYVVARDGSTREYRVAHKPWRVAPADHVIWDCDVAGTFDPPLADCLAAPPNSALIAAGSGIQLFRGRRL